MSHGSKYPFLFSRRSPTRWGSRFWHRLANCGRIDAAFTYGRMGILVCEQIYYEFFLALSEGFQEISRPFWLDFPLTFSRHLEGRYSIDASVYDPQSETLRVYMGDEYVDFRNKQQVTGTPATHVPIGYYEQSQETCELDHCVLCSKNSRKCQVCEEGFTLFYDKLSYSFYFSRTRRFLCFFLH